MDPQRAADMAKRRVSSSTSPVEPPPNSSPPKGEVTEVDAIKDTMIAISAVARAGRYGEVGRKIEVGINCYKAQMGMAADTVIHYDVTFRSTRKEVPQTTGFRGGRGGRGGRGRGRGGRGGFARPPPPPDEKTPPLRIAMMLIHEIEKREDGRRFKSGTKLAYDGRKNVYASQDPGWQQEEFKGETEEKEYQIVFKVAAKVPMGRLKDYLGKAGTHLPHDAVNALDIAMRTRPLREYVLTGRSFSLPNALDGSNVDKIDSALGLGCEAWRGYYQALKPIEAGLSLSFDVSYSAFYVEQTIVDFAVEVLKPHATGQTGGGPGKDYFPEGLTPYQYKILRNELRGLRCEDLHLPAAQRKEKVIDDLTIDPASKLSFPEEARGASVLVVDYFRSRGDTLKYPHLPCVEVAGKKGKPTYIPIELARIVAGQRRTKSMNSEMTNKMIGVASRAPDVRRRDIETMLGHASHETDEYLKAFGVKITLEPMTVKARVLDPPMLQYKDLDVQLDASSQELNWALTPGRKLFRTRNSLKNWGVLVLAPKVKDTAVKNFVKCLQHVCEEAGLEVSKPRFKFGYNISMQNDMQSLVSEVSSEGGECQLVLVVKQDIATNDYNRIKMIGDTILGIPTQCAVQENVENPREVYCQNMMLKINAKLGGVNMRVRPQSFENHVGDSPWMVVGADLSHAPAADSQDGASVTACVATMDRSCSSHVGRFRLQDSKAETIIDMGAMIYQLLVAFYAKNGFFPQKLLVYRDGVSDGQFAAVLNDEVNGIKDECARIGRDYEIPGGYSPPLTFVILQKRHHTRFFPLKDDEKDISGNCLAGTVIDADVTSPENYDFYMFSHNGIQGTSRPVRYTVLYDENSMKPDDIQSLTYNMCFTYARCTRTVSIVPVACLADLLAARGRAYLSSRKDAETEHEKGADGRRGLRGDAADTFAGGNASEPIVHAALSERLFWL
jgi:eukaryotic translation initiation factor 2C